MRDGAGQGRCGIDQAGEAMSGRRRIGVRETAKLLSVKRPAGHRLLSAFLRELDDGEIPETPATLALAAAFEQILFANGDASTVLQLKRSRGRTKHTAGELANRKGLKVLRFLLEYMKTDKSVTRAVAAATEKFAYKDERSVWGIWAAREQAPELKIESITQQYLDEQAKLMKRAAERAREPLAAFNRMLAEQQPVIEAYAATLSPKKRVAFMELAGQECFHIALAAKKKAQRKALKTK